MPRDGAIIFGDIEAKLTMLRVKCSKCPRQGQYNLARLIRAHGRDAKLADWLDVITADCPKKAARSAGAESGKLPPDQTINRMCASALHMSAFGGKAKSTHALGSSAFG